MLAFEDNSYKEIDATYTL